MKSIFSFSLCLTLLGCIKVISPTLPTLNNDVNFWLTNGSKKVYLEKQSNVLRWATIANAYPTINVDTTQIFQTIDGFGYTLTGGSAQVLNRLTAPKKQALLEELFGSTENAISVNYLRISIGASDLNAMPFTYNDVANGQADVNLNNFSLAPDSTDLLPMLKAILAINPNIKILATPWSAPRWMKDNNSFIGGSLKPIYYSVYANYFVKYIKAMQAQGIVIHAITPQNEPLNPHNNPSMSMTALQQADFIKNHLGPALAAAQLETKIIIYDHNCNLPEYPLTILNDAAANSFIDGSAFHLYEGEISALSTVHDAYPNKNIYFTEQYTASSGDFVGDLNWHLKNVIIGSMRHWSKVVLEWNLANDSAFEPHTTGGCTTCKGAITVHNANDFDRNVGYYIIAHASKFIPSGSVRIASNQTANINNVAFKTPTGQKVLILQNEGSISETFNIQFNKQGFTTSLEAGAVATFIWF